MERIGSAEWLKQHALFGCQEDVCREEQSHRAEDLRIHNGKPICQHCYEDWWMERCCEIDNHAEDGPGEREADPPHYSQLPAFDPFACIGASHD